MPKAGELVVRSAVTKSFLQPLKCVFVPDAGVRPGDPFLLTTEEGGCKVPFKVSKTSTVFPFRIARLEVRVGPTKIPQYFPALCGEGSRCGESGGSCSSGRSCSPGKSLSCCGLPKCRRFYNLTFWDNLDASCQDANSVLGTDDISPGWIRWSVLSCGEDTPPISTFRQSAHPALEQPEAASGCLL